MSPIKNPAKEEPIQDITKDDNSVLEHTHPSFEASSGWKDRLRDWSVHREVEDINDDGDEEATRVLSHASQFGVSTDEFVRLAHEKLPFFNSISELQASGYDFRRFNE